MLNTVHIEEASYEGNDQVLKEWWHQLEVNTMEKQKKMGEDDLIVWAGDQLTQSPASEVFTGFVLKILTHTTALHLSKNYPAGSMLKLHSSILSILNIMGCITRHVLFISSVFASCDG